MPSASRPVMTPANPHTPMSTHNTHAGTPCSLAVSCPELLDGSATVPVTSRFPAAVEQVSLATPRAKPVRVKVPRPSRCSTSSRVESMVSVVSDQAAVGPSFLCCRSSARPWDKPSHLA